MPSIYIYLAGSLTVQVLVEEHFNFLDGALYRVSLLEIALHPTQWGASPSKLSKNNTSTYTVETSTEQVCVQNHFNLHSGGFY